MLSRQDIEDGACLTCGTLEEVRFPLDPGAHLFNFGHIPQVEDLPKLCAALDITVERWEELANA